MNNLLKLNINSKHFYRWLRACFQFDISHLIGPIVCLICIFLKNKIAFIIFFSWLVFSYFKKIQETRKQISHIYQEDGYIHIIYIQGKQLKEIKIPICNISIKFYGTQYTFENDKIVFYNSNQKAYTQYNCYPWTPETMQAVAQKIEELKKEYKKEHETNTHLH